MEFVTATATQAAHFSAKVAKKLLWREVAAKKPWWKVTRPPPTYELRWSAIGALTAVAVGGALYYKYRTPRIRIVADPMMLVTEGLVPGSRLIDGGKAPACQVGVAIKKGDTYVVIGAGIRMDNYLITPTHNGHVGYDMYIVKDGRVARVETRDELYIAADASAFFVPESTWTDLRVRQVRMGPLNQSATVKIVSSCDAKYTIGEIRPVPDMIGRVVYNASTVPGFSGSAYMNGEVCHAMHFHGGVRGGGYEILYLWCRLKAMLKQSPEASEDFLMDLKRTDNVLEHEYVDNDFIVMRSKGGFYHLSDRQLFEKMKSIKPSSDWYDETEREHLADELRSRGYTPEALQIPSPTFSGECPSPVVAHETAGPQVVQTPPQVSPFTVPSSHAVRNGPQASIHDSELRSLPQPQTMTVALPAPQPARVVKRPTLTQRTVGDLTGLSAQQLARLLVTLSNSMLSQTRPQQPSGPVSAHR